jgi:hypothetical protein
MFTLKGKTVTNNQFLNVLAFVTTLYNDDCMKLAMLSPEYILEKYERYIGDPSKINKNFAHISGMHEILRSKFFEQYKKYWNIGDDSAQQITKLEDMVE